MHTTTKPALTLAALGLAAAPLALAVPAAAAEAPATTLTADLAPLNGSGADGEVMATLTGDQLDIRIHTTGLLQGAPHAQHVHIGGQGTCPSPDQRGSGANGALQTTDAAPSYGSIAVSLTTSGDTSPDSGLAVDRFPTGSDITYQRTITVSDDVAQSLRDGGGVVVQHGVDLNGSGTYDGDVPSDLDPSLPEEATDPAACGQLVVSQMSAMPSGGVDTGGGSTAGTERQGLLLGGAGLLAAGLAALGLRRRPRADQQV